MAFQPNFLLFTPQFGRLIRPLDWEHTFAIQDHNQLKLLCGCRHRESVIVARQQLQSLLLLRCCCCVVAAALLLLPCSHCCDIAQMRKHLKGFVLLFQLLSPFHLIRFPFFFSACFSALLLCVAVILLISQSNKQRGAAAILQQDVYCYGRATHPKFFVSSSSFCLATSAWT